MEGRKGDYPLFIEEMKMRRKGYKMELDHFNLYDNARKKRLKQGIYAIDKTKKVTTDDTTKGSKSDKTS